MDMPKKAAIVIDLDNGRSTGPDSPAMVMWRGCYGSWVVVHSWSGGKETTGGRAGGFAIDITPKEARLQQRYLSRMWMLPCGSRCAAGMGMAGEGGQSDGSQTSENVQKRDIGKSGQFSSRWLRCSSSREDVEGGARVLLVVFHKAAVVPCVPRGASPRVASLTRPATGIRP